MRSDRSMRGLNVCIGIMDPMSAMASSATKGFTEGLAQAQASQPSSSAPTPTPPPPPVTPIYSMDPMAALAASAAQGAADELNAHKWPATPTPAPEPAKPRKAPTSHSAAPWIALGVAGAAALGTLIYLVAKRRK